MVVHIRRERVESEGRDHRRFYVLVLDSTVSQNDNITRRRCEREARASPASFEPRCAIKPRHFCRLGRNNVQQAAGWRFWHSTFSSTLRLAASRENGIVARLCIRHPSLCPLACLSHPLERLPTEPGKPACFCRWQQWGRV